MENNWNVDTATTERKYNKTILSSSRASRKEKFLAFIEAERKGVDFMSLSFGTWACGLNRTK